MCRGNLPRYTRTVGSGAPLTYTWDLNIGLPVVLQDGASTYVYGLGLISQTEANGNNSRLTVLARQLERFRAGGYTQHGDYLLPPGGPLP